MLISGRVHSGLFGIYSFGYYITIETFLGNLNFFFVEKKQNLLLCVFLTIQELLWLSLQECQHHI